ncbi:MAG: phage portal protein [Candidatus Lokiarchaeota archaeon]|nr:phage portal protein [Candidatus Lokiarchaeota archaeon]
MAIGFETVTRRDYDSLQKALSGVSSGRRAFRPDYMYDNQINFSGSNGGKKVRVSEPIISSRINYETMHSLYKHNEWVRAIVDKIVKRTVAIPHKVLPVNPPVKPGSEISKETKRHIEILEELFINPNSFVESFLQIRKKLANDLLIYDAGVLEIVKGVNLLHGRGEEVPVEIFSVAGDTIKKNVDRRGNFGDPDVAYIQKLAGKKVAEFAHNELIYMMQYPRSGYDYGCSPLETLYNSILGDLQASDYNLDFFKNNATPRFAVLFKNMGISDEPADNTLRRWLQYWDQELKGKPHRPILLGSEEGDIEFKTTGLTHEEMQFQEYSNWLLMKIMAVYGMQPLVMGLIDKSTGKLNSEQQYEQFKADAIVPLLEVLSTAINEVLIWNPDGGFGYKDVYISWKGLDKSDDKKDAEINEIYARMGAVTINEVRSKVNLPPVPWGNIAYVNQALIPIGTNPQIVQSQMPGAQKSYNPGTGMNPEEEANVLMKLITEREKQLNNFFSYRK